MPVNPLELAGPALTLAALAAGITRLLGATPLWRGAAALAVALAAVMPFGSLTIAAVSLTTIGPSSAASLVIFAGLLLGVLRSQDRMPRPSWTFLAAVLVSGLTLYPMAFGLTAFDPYDLGFRGPALPIAMAAFVVVGWLTNSRDTLCWIALAAALHAVEAYGSRNVWDYLIDPLAWLIVLAIRIGLPVLSLSRREVHPDVRLSQSVPPDGPRADR